MKNKEDIIYAIKFDNYNLGKVSKNFSKVCHYMLACDENFVPYAQYDLNEICNKSELNEENKFIIAELKNKFIGEFENILYHACGNPEIKHVFFTEKRNKKFRVIIP